MTKEEYHIAFGRHSLIPECCIRFFVEEWDARELWRNRSLWFVRMNRKDNVQYVRCPDCLVNGRRAKIHFCDGECAKDFLEKEVSHDC
jgi:hypothetical protein